MDFLDYDNKTQSMIICYSKETLMEALQIISHYSDYDELRKGVVKAIKAYDNKEIVEYKEKLTENNLQCDACLLACLYKYAVSSHTHKSPEGIFSVRGHFRKYKSGKVIWIDEYLKGTDKNE